MVKRIKILLLILFTFATAFLLFSLGNEFILNYKIAFSIHNLTTIETPGENSRVLIFSPHNDDELLGAGELIRRVIKNRGSVKIVFITNGDGFKNGIKLDYFKLNPKPRDYINYGYARQKESLKVAQSLGLKDDDVIFLGYPDGGVSFLWNTNWDKIDPFISQHTQTSSSPYYNSYTSKALYCGQSIISDISKIINEFKPTHVIFPHPNDRHPDHWATNCFVNYVLASTSYKPEKEWLYLVHRGDWPTPMKRNPNLYLVPPEKLINTGTNWFALPLDNNDISDKTSLIRLYRTQIRIIGPLLVAFERKNELFGEYGDVEIKQNIHSDNDISPVDANKVITDPLQDAISLEIRKSADISAVYAEISKSSKLHVYIQFDSDVERQINYNLNLFFFSNSKVSRLNLVYRNNKLELKEVSSQSVMYVKGIDAIAKGHYIHIIIPLEFAGEFHNIYLNASTSLKHNLLDKSAWRMLSW